MLGGTDQRSRHQAVKMLRDYLRARAEIGTGSGISELDLMKLWKVSLELMHGASESGWHFHSIVNSCR